MIKVMSFNIRYGTAEDGANHWEKRKPLVLERIREFGPDLLGIQECRDDSQAVFIKTSLPEYEFYGVQRGGGPETALEMAPILFRRDAFRVHRTGHFWLSETPTVPGSKSWGSTFARTATWAELFHLPTQRMLTFVNTHFDYEPSAIEGAARFLRTCVAETIKKSPVILTGDFNAVKDSFAYQTLMGAEWRDAYRASGGDVETEGTFHGFGTAGKINPIDWVLVSEHFHATESHVDRTGVKERFPSDHYPVLAILKWAG
ncbi:MAG TPA: endonuclease/exonuclease/phosphatase family protein [Anaerolineales bacterium]|nr:endonuclease/exonuclease/phosphatase family protein [Anaerolineales bacterium]